MGWLEPDGCALIDVYTCFDAFRGDGKLEREGDVIHRYAYDPDGNRMLASEWPVGADESEAVAQSLRSYTPADFRLLREGTGLAMDTYQPFGDEGPTTSLIESWMYRAKVVRQREGTPAVSR